MQEKISSFVQEKWFNESYASYVDYYHHYSYDICESWSITIYFSDKFGVGSVSFLANSISPNDRVIKASKYRMVFYFMEIPHPEYPFFSKLTKFE